MVWLACVFSLRCGCKPPQTLSLRPWPGPWRGQRPEAALRGVWMVALSLCPHAEAPPWAPVSRPLSLSEQQSYRIKAAVRPRFNSVASLRTFSPNTFIP